MNRTGATVIAALVLTQTAPVHAGPTAFDDAPRLVESVRMLPTGGAQAVSIPTRVSAQAVTGQAMQVTGTLRVTMNGFDPVIFPAGGPSTVFVARDMPGSLPRSFFLPASFIVGSNLNAPPTATGLVDNLRMTAANWTVSVTGGVGGVGGLNGTGDISVLGGLVHLPVYMSPVGSGGTISGGHGPLTWKVKGQPWAVGVVGTSTVTASGTHVATASGSRGANSISLVTAFMYSTNAAGPIPGIARLNLNFQPLGGGTTTTTTTTLPPVDLDVGIDATKLVIVDKLESADKAKVVFVAKTPAAAKGPGTDVDAIGAVLDVSYMGSSATAGQFDVPAGALSGDAGWKVNKDTVAKFVNKAAPGAPTGAKVAVIKPEKLLKLVGKSLGDAPIAVKTAGAPDAGGVDVIYSVFNGGSTVRHCTNFAQAACTHKQIAGDTGAKLVCKGGTPAVCP